MELPSRAKNDRYTRPGQYLELERSLRANPETADIPVLVCYAFDWRTRLGPFLFADTRLLTAGPRAVAGALHAAGFTQNRIVLRQWNRNFRAHEARLDGQIPKMLFVSSMQIHSACAYDMIADAYKLGEERPFILAGGASTVAARSRGAGRFSRRRFDHSRQCWSLRRWHRARAHLRKDGFLLRTERRVSGEVVVVGGHPAVRVTGEAAALEDGRDVARE